MVLRSEIREMGGIIVAYGKGIGVRWCGGQLLGIPERQGLPQPDPGLLGGRPGRHAPLDPRGVGGEGARGGRFDDDRLHRDHVLFSSMVVCSPGYPK